MGGSESASSIRTENSAPSSIFTPAAAAALTGAIGASAAMALRPCARFTAARPAKPARSKSIVSCRPRAWPTARRRLRDRCDARRAWKLMGSLMAALALHSNRLQREQDSTRPQCSAYVRIMETAMQPSRTDPPHAPQCVGGTSSRGQAWWSRGAGRGGARRSPCWTSGPASTGACGARRWAGWRTSCAAPAAEPGGVLGGLAGGARRRPRPPPAVPVPDLMMGEGLPAEPHALDAPTPGACRSLTPPAYRPS